MTKDLKSLSGECCPKCEKYADTPVGKARICSNPTCTCHSPLSSLLAEQGRSLDDKFTDQWWASTQGRNDKRNEAIKQFLAQSNLTVIERIREIVTNELTPHEYESDDPLIENAIQTSKEKHLAKILAKLFTLTDIKSALDV